MAASMQWRKSLKFHDIFQYLRKVQEHATKETDSKDLLAVRGCDIYVWNTNGSDILTTNLKYIAEKSDPEKSSKLPFQRLFCTDPPLFDVESILLSPTGNLLALIGPRGVSVVELPRQWGKYASFEGGKEKINCRTHAIEERHFSSHSKVKVLHAAWYPGSETDSCLVVLTSDSQLRFYDVCDGHAPIQVIPLSDTDSEFGSTVDLSTTRKGFTVALGELPVSFDFGEPIPVQYGKQEDQKEMVQLIYILWGNGNVYSLAVSLTSKRFSKPQLTGPLSMHPPAEDNYGTDACSILCLRSNPPVLVVATCSGNLYHCVVLNQEEEKYCELFSKQPIPLPESTLYVYESVELELSLTTVAIETDEVIEDDFSCPIKLHRDDATSIRYHCSHSAGVHTVILPWIDSLENFCLDPSSPEIKFKQTDEAIVEHLVCTKPVATSPPSPIFGLCVVTDTVLGTTLLALTSVYECIALPLLSRYKRDAGRLLSVSGSGKKYQSPMKEIAREPFDIHIQNALARDASNPLLKTTSKTDLSPQECFQLLSRSTQIFREEYIQKQELAREDIQRRVRFLREQKKYLSNELQKSREARNILTDKARQMADRYDDTYENQRLIVQRVENVLRKVQSRLPVLSDEEKDMHKELKSIEERMKRSKNSLEQIRVKQRYQRNQILHQQDEEKPKKGMPNKQSTMIKTLLKDEGDQICDMVKNLKLVMSQVGVINP
ncbi:nucleoporin 88-like [Lineus longissimus]|uniref:nucleoporin 88-like n=1 Tax=Lineus longissimus TaxID=88925 RepID=UPI002B4C8DBC